MRGRQPQVCYVTRCTATRCIHCCSGGVDSNRLAHSSLVPLLRAPFHAHIQLLKQAGACVLAPVAAQPKRCGSGRVLHGVSPNPRFTAPAAADAPTGTPATTGDAAAAAVAAADAREAAERDGADPTDATPPPPPPPNALELHQGTGHGYGAERRAPGEGLGAPGPGAGSSDDGEAEGDHAARAAAFRGQTSGVMTAAIAAQVFERVRHMAQALDLI